MLRPIHLLKFLLFCLIAAAAANPAGADRAAAAETLKIGGTGSALGDMTRLADAYMRTHPDTKIVVLPSLASAGGIRALRADTIGIAITAEPVSPEETAAGLTAVPYAKTALGFATRADTPVDAVTSAWLSDVYRGTVTQWPDGTPIRLVLRPEHDSDTKIISISSAVMTQAVNAALNRPGLLIEDTAQAAAQKLAQLKGSLGSASLAQIKSEQVAIKLLAFDGVMPSAETLASGRYPLVRTFYHVTKVDASAAVRDFIAFLKSDEAAAILAKTGNVMVTGAPRG